MKEEKETRSLAVIGDFSRTHKHLALKLFWWLIGYISVMCVTNLILLAMNVIKI